MSFLHVFELEWKINSLKRERELGVCFQAKNDLLEQLADYFDDWTWIMLFCLLQILCWIN